MANDALSTSMQRLSTGKRINSAKDDAAGLAISNSMTSQIRGMSQGIRNANDGISLVQTAEGALGQINDNVQRIRELTVQAANGTNSEEDLQSIQDEITQRLEEIDRIANQTTFNGVEVLAPDTDSINIQVGANDGEFITVNLKAADVAALGLTDFTVVDADFEGDGLLEQLDDALGTIDTLRSELGAVQNRFEDAIINLNTNSTNLSAARSRIEDADYAVEVANMTRAQILQQAGTSVLAQANQIPQNVLSLLG